VTVRLLSARHREVASYCDCCGRNVGRKRYVVRLLVEASVIRLCVPCLREATRIAVGK
jgi:hypothetical protein